MSAGGSSDGPVIGDGGQGEEADVVEQLRSAAAEAMAVAREGAKAKEEELWARYRELTKGRREGRKR